MAVIRSCHLFSNVDKCFPVDSYERNVIVQYSVGAVGRISNGTLYTSWLGTPGN